MKKLLLASLCFLMLCVTQVFAQNRTVTGTVTAKEDGLPIPGATVKVKGTNIGTQTNTAGKFTVAPGMGRPSSLAVTVPVIVRFCANTCVTHNIRKHKLTSRSFFISLIIRSVNS